MKRKIIKYIDDDFNMSVDELNILNKIKNDNHLTFKNNNNNIKRNFIIYRYISVLSLLFGIVLSILYIYPKKSIFLSTKNKYDVLIFALFFILVGIMCLILSYKKKNKEKE